MLPRATAVDAEPQYVECPRCGGERWLEDDERARPYLCPDCDSAGRIALTPEDIEEARHFARYGDWL